MAAQHYSDVEIKEEWDWPLTTPVTEDESPCPTCGQSWPTSLGWASLLGQEGRNNSEIDSELQNDGDEEKLGCSIKFGRDQERNTRMNFGKNVPYSPQFLLKGLPIHEESTTIVANARLIDNKGKMYLVVGGANSPHGFALVLKTIDAVVKSKKQNKHYDDHTYAWNPLDDLGDNSQVIKEEESSDVYVALMDSDTLDNAGEGDEWLKIGGKTESEAHQADMSLIADSCKRVRQEKKTEGIENREKTSKNVAEQDSLIGPLGCHPNLQSSVDNNRCKRKKVANNELTSEFKGFECRHCKRYFRMKVILKWHLHKVHGIGNKLVCDACGKIFFSKREILKHWVNKHALQPLTSQACGLNLNKEAHKGVKCVQCNKQLSSPRALRRHMNTHLGIKKYACKVCNKSFVSTSNRRRHFSEKHMGRTFLCEICLKSFTQKSARETHMFSVHLGRRIKCEMCDKDYAQKSQLLYHKMDKHSFPKPFLCETCGQQCATKRQMKNHIITFHPGIQVTFGKGETSLETNICQLCGKSNQSQAHLRRHTYLVHSDLKPFLCDLCGKSFKLKLNLTIHMNIHLEIKPYPCRLCGRRFAQKRNWHRHQLVHTKEKLFKCPTCDKAFTVRQTLNNHMLAHAGIKRYNCIICNLKFTEKRSLNNHTKRHLVNLNSECCFCRVLFRSKKTLERHVLSCSKMSRKDFKDINDETGINS